MVISITTSRCFCLHSSDIGIVVVGINTVYGKTMRSGVGIDRSLIKRAHRPWGLWPGWLFGIDRTLILSRKLLLLDWLCVFGTWSRCIGVNGLGVCGLFGIWLGGFYLVLTGPLSQKPLLLLGPDVFGVFGTWSRCIRCI